MDFAKPGEPKFALTQINQPIEEAIKLTAVFMRKSGIKVEKDLAEDLPFCFADPNLIEETVLNLLNNAAESMKNMEAGKKIAISSKLENDRIYVKVSDSGPGVPLDIRQNVFDPFYTTKNGGTGIGLSICHRIISDHKGALTVLDSEMGGAEFRIELPVKNDAA